MLAIPPCIIQAYFLRTIHIQPGRIRRLYVVTNNWHMPRTKAIFSKIFSLPDLQTSSDRVSGLVFTRFMRDSTAGAVELMYEETPPGISDGAVLSARVAREQQSLKSFNEKVAPKWHSLQDLHKWIFTEHAAYRAKRLLEKKKPLLSPEELKTY